MIRTPEIWLANVMPKDEDYGVFFHGGMLHHIREFLEDGIGRLVGVV